ncbi:hypothetical protein IMZ48_06400, partial [Candidatus Bathyarchaeota archaeon]|nr:hypothetical protein [Candidatus Bathyarchaeota archaeon]
MEAPVAATRVKPSLAEIFPEVKPRHLMTREISTLVPVSPNTMRLIHIYERERKLERERQINAAPAVLSPNTTSLTQLYELEKERERTRQTNPAPAQYLPQWDNVATMFLPVEKRLEIKRERERLERQQLERERLERQKLKSEELGKEVDEELLELAGGDDDESSDDGEGADAQLIEESTAANEDTAPMAPAAPIPTTQPPRLFQNPQASSSERPRVFKPLQNMHFLPKLKAERHPAAPQFFRHPDTAEHIRVPPVPQGSIKKKHVAKKDPARDEKIGREVFGGQSTIEQLQRIMTSGVTPTTPEQTRLPPASLAPMMDVDFVEPFDAMDISYTVPPPMEDAEMQGGEDTTGAVS